MELGVQRNGEAIMYTISVCNVGGMEQLDDDEQWMTKWERTYSQAWEIRMNYLCDYFKS